MTKNTIEYLAYLLDEAKKKGKEKAIVFLGAGASKSAGIPLTSEIIDDIKRDYSDNPMVRQCISDNKTDYLSMMNALTSDQRRDLFHSYVTNEEVKLNLANVYLAQLLKEEYVDYIVTVNFDDLIQKACAIFNFLPPVYDISNIDTVTTSDIRKGSVIYLHGQYFGQWLLNNDEELNKVENEVYALFNNLKTRRTWIVIGYSGNDGIFDKMKSLGSFSNEFFWVKKELHPGNDAHVIEFLDTPNNNAHCVQGYYADAFFLKLHAELSKRNEDLMAPEIFYKPFSYLKSVMQNVNEIKDDDDLNKQVKIMVENCNDRIDKAINKFENQDSIEDFKQKIIDAILKSDFNALKSLEFEKEIKEKEFYGAKEELSWYYNDWGNEISDIAKQKFDEVLYNESFEHFKRAINLSPKDDSAYNNYGISLSDLAKQKSDEKLYKKSFEQYDKAIELNFENDSAHYNYGTALSDFARQNYDEELYKKSFEHYEMAIKLNPKDDSYYNNYGTSISDLAKQKFDEELYKKSFEQYDKSIKLNSKNYLSYFNYGNIISDLAKQKSDENLYKRSFEKYEKAIELNSKSYEVYLNYGIVLAYLAKQKSDENLYQRSFVQYEKVIKLNPENDLARCGYANTLTDLAVKNSDEELFKRSFVQYNMAIELNPKDDSYYNNYGTSISYLAKQKSDDVLFKRSFEQYEKAIELSPEKSSSYYNYGSALSELGKQILDQDLFKKSRDILKKAYELGSGSYNLSCINSLLRDKENALKLLEKSLIDKEVFKEEVRADNDWQYYLDDKDFQELLAKY